MNDKSIIGFGYTPNNAKAVCLKTNHETRLGGAEYKIIADPYERAFIKTVHNPGGTRVRYDAMAVNILDPLTGLTTPSNTNPQTSSVRPRSTNGATLKSSSVVVAFRWCRLTGVWRAEAGQKRNVRGLLWSRMIYFRRSRANRRSSALLRWTRTLSFDA